MAFDPKTLPPGVLAAYKQGPKYWPLALQKALEATIYNITTLTDMVFCMHHPERVGNPLKPFETKLINEWKAFRTTITPVANLERHRHSLLFNGAEGTDVPGF